MYRIILEQDGVLKKGALHNTKTGAKVPTSGIKISEFNYKNSEDVLG